MKKLNENQKLFSRFSPLNEGLINENIRRKVKTKKSNYIWFAYNSAKLMISQEFIARIKLQYI